MSKSNNLFVIRSLVAPSYSKPSFSSSKITEALSGETVKVLDKKKDWLYIEQDDGYKSWIKDFYGTIETEHFLSDYMVTEKSPYPFGTRLRYNKGTFLTVNGEKYILDASLYELKDFPTSLTMNAGHGLKDNLNFVGLEDFFNTSNGVYNK